MKYILLLEGLSSTAGGQVVFICRYPLLSPRSGDGRVPANEKNASLCSLRLCGEYIIFSCFFYFVISPALLNA